MRADFCRNAVDVSGGVERGAGAFVHAATVPDVAAFAFLLVAFQEGVQFGAGDLVESGKDVALLVGRVFFGGDEAGAGEYVPVGRDAEVAAINMAGVVPVSFPGKQEFHFVLDCAEVETVSVLAAFNPVSGHFAVLLGEPFEVFAGPLPVEIHAGRHAPETLRMQPLDALGDGVDVCPRNGAEGGRLEFHESRNVLFDCSETAGVVDRAARDVLVVLGTVEREKNGEFLPFAQVEEFVVEQGSVRIYREFQTEILADGSLVDGFGDKGFGKSYSVVDGVSAQERLPAEKRDYQEVLPEGVRAFEADADGLFKGCVVHDRISCGLRVFVIAVGAAQVALLCKAED